MRSIIALTLFVAIQAHASPDCKEEADQYIKECTAAINGARYDSNTYMTNIKKETGAYAAGEIQTKISQNGLGNIGVAKRKCTEARKNCWRACDKAAQTAYAKKDEATVKQATRHNERCADQIENRTNGLAGEQANLEAQGVAGGQAVSQYSK